MKMKVTTWNPHCVSPDNWLRIAQHSRWPNIYWSICICNKIAIKMFAIQLRPKYIGQTKWITKQSCTDDRIVKPLVWSHRAQFRNLLADLCKYQWNWCKNNILRKQTISSAISHWECALKWTAMPAHCFDFISVAHLKYN